MQTSDQSDQRVNEAIAEYLAGCDAGAPPERTEFLARHHDVAVSLRKFLDDHDRIRRAAPPLRSPADTATLMPGAAVASGAVLLDTIKYFGDYEVLAEIARGGMGVVYRAKQVSLNRVVAVKMILAGELASAADVQRFRSEAEAAAGLDHPNIVPIYEVGEHNGQHYFTMKLVEGGTLANWISDRRSTLVELKKPQQAEIAQTLATIARAVHYAHQRGILHRDLKPGNVLLSFSRDAESSERSASRVHEGTLRSEDSASRLNGLVPLITDFGLAKRTEGDAALTGSGAIVGTPSYMAPEQARSEKSLTTAVDVYSLGAILHEMLAGRPPFVAATPFDTLLQVLESEPPRLRGMVPGIDRDLETICLKCLEKDPARRYGSAEALAEDLDRWLRGDLIHARPSRQWERAARWLKRRPAIAALAAISALALAALFAEGILFSVRLREKSEEVAAREADVRDANTRAGRHETAAQKAHEDADRVKKQSAADARAAARAVTQVLSRANITAGWRHVDTGDYRSALPLFAQALKLEADDPRRAELHRVSFGTILRRFGRPVQVIAEDDGVRRVALSPDGKRVACGTLDFNKQRGIVRVYDLATGRPLFAPLEHDGGGAQIEFSKDGKYLLTRTFHWSKSEERKIWAIKSKVRVWLAETGKPVTPWLEHPGSILHACFSADGKRFLTASYNAEAKNTGGLFEKYLGELAGKGSVKVWETATGRLLHTLPFGRSVVFADFSPDGALIAVVGDKTTRIHDVQTGRQLHVFSHQGRDSVEIRCAAMNRSGALLTAGVDRVNEVGEVFLWHPATGKRIELRSMTQPQSVEQVVWSPDGEKFLTRSKSEVRLWNANTGRSLPFPPLKHDDLTLVSTGDPRGTGVLPAGFEKREQEMNHAAFSPDGRRVLTVGRDGFAKVWDVATGKLVVPPLRHDGGIWDGLFTPDGRGVITASDDKTVRMWDVAGVQPVLEPMRLEKAIQRVFFLSGQYFCSVSGEIKATKKEKQILRLWSVRTGKPMGPPLPHDEPIQRVAFRPEDQRVFGVTEEAGGSNKLRAWDARTGAALPSPVKHGARATLQPSTDGRYLLEMGAGEALSRDANLWDLSTGRLIGSLKHDENVLGVGFGNPSQFALTISGKDARRNEVRIWDLPAQKLRFPPVAVDAVVHEVRISRDNRRMMLLADKQRIVRSTDTGELLARAEQDEHYLNPAMRAYDERTQVRLNDQATRNFRVWTNDDASGQKASPPFHHPASVLGMDLSQNKYLLLTACEDRTLWLWDVSPDERPVEDLLRESEMMTGYRFDPSGNLEQVKAGEWHKAWTALRAKYPDRFAPSSTEQVVIWHHQQLLASEAEENPFASIWHLDRLIAARPKDGNLYYRRGLAHYRAGIEEGTQDGIVADLSRAIALDVNGSDVFVKRGELHDLMGNWKEALADFTEALKRGADRATILPKRGRALVKLEQWKEAIEALSEATRLAPKDASAWQDRGIALGNLRRWKEAIHDHDQAIRLAPSEFYAWEELGTAQAELGRFDLAEKHFTKALERSASATASLCEALGWLSLRRGDLAGYRRACTSLLSVYGHTTDPEYANYVAWICAFGPGDGMDLARPLLLAELAVWRHPDERANLHTLAAVLYRRGKHAEAIRLLMKSVTKDGKGGDAWDHLFLAMAHHKLGHAGEARDWLKKADKWIAEVANQRKDPRSALDWKGRLGVQVLRREAEELLKRTDSEK